MTSAQHSTTTLARRPARRGRRAAGQRANKWRQHPAPPPAPRGSPHPKQSLTHMKKLHRYKTVSSQLPFTTQSAVALNAEPRQSDASVPRGLTPRKTVLPTQRHRVGNQERDHCTWFHHTTTMNFQSASLIIPIYISIAQSTVALAPGRPADRRAVNVMDDAAGL